VGGSVGGGGGGGGAVVVVVLVVVDVVVLVVEVVVEEVATWARASLVAVACWPPPSSRPWKTTADVDATAMAATMQPPMTHARVLNRPTLRASARTGPRLRIPGPGPVGH
jgi:hypothetical protein